uniref:Retrotransposon Copia-like N-terminal domain-containing protein n=1 Tax=Cannabis sativa TaxID=3483 RepID=A0A803PSQ4_CANSA
MARMRATFSSTPTDRVDDAPAQIDPSPSHTSAEINNNPAPPPQQQPQIDRPAYEDIRSPYYLSNADHPGMTPFLKGTIPKPSSNDPLYGSWIKCNQMVMSWILHFVSPEIKSSIMYLDTAAEMWNVLHNRFNQGNGPRIFELNETLTYLHQGLSESYHAIRDQILLLDPCPPLDKVFSMTIHQERQRTIGHRTIPTFYAATTPTPAAYDHAPAANQASRNKKPRPMCSHCQKPGHYKDKCYFLHGFPPGYGNRKPADATNNKKSDPSSSNRNPQSMQISTTNTDASQPQLTSSQCQQIISMLAQQLQPTPDASTSTDALGVNNLTGTFSDLEDWDC